MTRALNINSESPRAKVETVRKANVGELEPNPGPSYLEDLLQADKMG